ncbi:hypothetical protein [Agaribacterium sp. ZY112]|uniref:hypothetical protein n=1 Tax=Agaribacterium sp. ZY112 TaxID=3233574 RepID=UPI0035266B70
MLNVLSMCRRYTSMRFVFSFLVLTTLVACSSSTSKPLPSDEGSILKGKSFTYSRYKELPDFPVSTAANFRSGILDIASAVTSGNKMLKNAAIEDPAVTIAKSLSARIEKRFGMHLQANDSLYIRSKKTNNVIKKYNDVDYVLDVRTLNWSASYIPNDWDNYRVTYSVQARLINVDTGLVVSEEVCTHTPDYADSNQAPTYQALEHGTALSDEIDKSVAFCVDHISKLALFHAQQNKSELLKTLQ